MPQAACRLRCEPPAFKTVAKMVTIAKIGDVNGTAMPGPCHANMIDNLLNLGPRFNG
jgi:hypothetical protein